MAWIVHHMQRCRYVGGVLHTGDGFVQDLCAVHLDRIDEPVGVDERLWLGSNIGGAAGICLGARGRAPDTAGPVAAESDVEDNVHGSEFGVVVASSAKVGGRSAPAVGVRVAVADVGRHVSRGKVPYLDAGGGPERSVDTAPVGIEG